MDSRQLLQTAAGELHGPTQQAHPFVPQFVARQGQVCQALVVDESRGQVLAGGGCEPAAPQAARREARKEMTAQPVKNPPASAGGFVLILSSQLPGVWSLLACKMRAEKAPLKLREQSRRTASLTSFFLGPDSM